MHRKNIGYLYLAQCVLVFGVTLWTVIKTAIEAGSYVALLMMPAVFMFLVSVVLLAAGVLLLKDVKWAHKFVMPVSAVFLLNFPIGTAVSVYYFWYYFNQRPKTS